MNQDKETEQISDLSRDWVDELNFSLRGKQRTMGLSKYRVSV